jgi:hypothetical protein
LEGKKTRKKIVSDFLVFFLLMEEQPNENDGVLDAPLDERALYSLQAPFFGPVKVRWECVICLDETVLSLGKTWRRQDGGFAGECMSCGSKVVQPVLLSASTRVVIYRHTAEETDHTLVAVLKALTGGPDWPREVDFLQDCAAPPSADDTSLMGKLFFFDRAVRGKPVHEKQKVIRTSLTEKHWANAGTWEIIVPSRWPVSFEPQQRELRRELLVEQAKAWLFAEKSDLRSTLVTVTLAHESAAGAIDRGGPRKAYFEVMSKTFLDPFIAILAPSGPNGTFFFQAQKPQQAQLELLRVYGCFLGKALLCGQLVDAPLCPIIWKMLARQPLTFLDLALCDEDLFRRLKLILEYDADTLEAVTLTFSVDMEELGTRWEVDLVEDGQNVPVTTLNRAQFCKLYAEHRMLHSVKDQVASFLEGFYSVVPAQVISVFSTPGEIEVCINGESILDIQDWRQYADSDQIEPEVVGWFWEILTEMSNQDRGRVMEYATGSSRVPGSFSLLHPRFVLRRQEGIDRMPIAHTCFNMLDLSRYSSKKILERLLFLSLNLGMGFSDR